jgi:thiaminase/transcriptional activator TenA
MSIPTWINLVRTHAMIAHECWEEAQSLARATLAHPFVQGIATGTLPRQRFAHYVGQDAFFLDAFARAYALALAKSPDREGVATFKTLLDGAFNELQLHQGFAAKWGIDLAPTPSAATRAYVDFLLSVAALEPVGHICAAMAPCMRLYAFLGQELKPRQNPASPYREWVETYSSPDFQRLAEQLEGLLDRYGGDVDRLREHYHRAMTLEYRFFDAAWREDA